MGYILKPTAAPHRPIPRPRLLAPVDNSRETAKNEVPQFFTVNSGRRFYSPELGRWLSRDPLLSTPWIQQHITQRLGEGLNHYMFVGNAVVDRIDPFGLAGCTASKCCSCKSISVTFAPGGTSFGGVVLNTAYGRFGNTIHVVHTVTGDPTKCSYKHNEGGSYWWNTPYGRGTGAGTSNDATTGADVLWGCDSFEYWDRLGLTKPTPLLSGEYFIGFSGDFTMQMTCTGTDGVTISSPVYPITGQYLANVP